MSRTKEPAGPPPSIEDLIAANDAAILDVQRNGQQPQLDGKGKTKRERPNLQTLMLMGQWLEKRRKEQPTCPPVRTDGVPSPVSINAPTPAAAE